MALLSRAEIDQLLADHPDWVRSGPSLARRLEFRDFAEAARFVGRLGERVPARDPYPEVRLHGFSTITLTLGHENHAGMSVADVRLVEALDAMLAEPAPDPTAPVGPSAPATDTLSSGVVPEAAAAAAQDGTLEPPVPPAAPPRGARAAAPPHPPAAPAGAPAAARRLPSVAAAAGLVVAGALAGAVVADRRHRRRARRWHTLGLRGR